MTLPFALRELRRQAPIPAGLFAVSLLLPALDAILRVGPRGGFANAFLLVVIATPFLLAVATVAPDVESGAAAFLARLPFPRWRELAVRWSVALALTTANIVASYVVLEAICGVDMGPPTAIPGGAVAMALAAFAGGLAASVAVRRSLAAAVVAPLLVAACAYPIGRSVLALAPDAPTDEVLAFSLVAAPILAIAAAIAFLRGDVHRRSRRPAALIAITTAALTILACGVTFAYDRAARRMQWLPMDIPDPTRRHVVIRGMLVGGLGEARAVRHWVCSVTDLHEVREVSGTPVGYSPDGSQLVTIVDERWGATVRVVDLATGKTLTRSDAVAPGSSRVLHVSAPGMPRHWYGGPQGVAWRRGEPLFALERSLSTWSGEAVSLPRGRVHDASGPRVLLCRESGEWFLWDVEREAEVPTGLDRLPGDARLVDVALGPGDWVAAVALVPKGGEPRPVREAFLVGEGGARVHAVELGPDKTPRASPAPIVPDVYVTFRGARALVQVSTAPPVRWVVHLGTDEIPCWASTLPETVYLSPDGERSWSNGSVMSSLGSASVDERTRDITLGFVDGHRVFVNRRGLSDVEILDLDTGALTKVR